MGCTHGTMVVDNKSTRDILNLIELYNSEKFAFNKEEINLIQKSFTLFNPKEMGIKVMTR